MRLDTQQSLALDYAKAMAIIAVVIGHYAGSPFNYFHIYSWHMPFFFLIGGMMLNPDKSAVSVYSGLLRKYLAYIVVLYITTGLLAEMAGYLFPIAVGQPFQTGLIETISLALRRNFHNNAFFMVAWFLFAYMIISAAAYPLIKGLSSLISGELLRSLLLVAIASICAYIGIEHVAREFQAQPERQSLNLLAQVLVGGSFYLVGFSLRHWIWRSLSLYGFVIAFLILYVLIHGGLGRPSTMSWSNYFGGAAVVYFRALAGIYCVLVIASMLASWRRHPLLLEVGRNTKVIMTFHLFALLALDILFHYFGPYDISKTTALKHYFDPSVFGLYVAAGVLLPLAGKRLLTRLYYKVVSVGSALRRQSYENPGDCSPDRLKA